MCDQAELGLTQGKRHDRGVGCSCVAAVPAVVVLVCGGGDGGGGGGVRSQSSPVGGEGSVSLGQPRPMPSHRSEDAK
jgi:hypothetical protein